MLSWVDWQLQKVPSVADENVHDKEAARDYVMRIAQAKSASAAIQCEAEDFIIAADTIVVQDGEILGKPNDEQNAYRILSQLRGTTHQVMTALTVRKCAQDHMKIDVCCSDVTMREYSEAELWLYIKSGDPMDKAGAYAIQDAVFRPVMHFSGCMASVMGMPLCHLERTLRKFPDYQPTAWSEICQKNLDYNCPITEKVMAGENIG